VGISRLNHAVLYVRDVDRSVAFYRDLLGFRVVMDRPGRAAFMQAPDSTNDHDIGLFALGAMGGGDVKMIGAVMLWIPLYLYFPMLTIMAIGGGILSAVMLIQSKIRPSDKAIEVPYGLAIAAGGLWAVHQHYLNQFQFIGST